MRLSRFFLPVLKEDPAEAEIASHRLMLRAGMVRQAGSGIYSWLPLGLRVMRQIAAVIREEQDLAGAHEILMPTIQQAELWRESGRYADYGQEMLRIADRRGREMLYGPTNEEQITDIIRKSVTSYKQLPQLLYHVQWKFRDEIRPRFGVMRGREFLMKDAYSFDISKKTARHSYARMFVSYLRIFHRLGLSAIPARAATGPIGGDLSHEFVILADNGESDVFFDSNLLEAPIPGSDVDFDAPLEVFLKPYTQTYAATDDLHDPEKLNEQVPQERQMRRRAIEVGHIFYFGTKYSEPMQARVQDEKGQLCSLHMGSYGIGVSRLVGAIMEANADERGCCWPVAVAPFACGVIDLCGSDAKARALCTEIYARLRTAGIDTLLDDTKDSAGEKFARMDLIGLPLRIVVGKKAARNAQVEVKRRADTQVQHLGIEDALRYIEAQLEGKR